MVDFTKQRKIRGKPGLVDAGGVPLSSGAHVPRVRDLAEEKRVRELLLAKAVVEFLVYCPGADAVQCIIMGEKGVKIDAFSTEAQAAGPDSEDGECVPS